MSEQPNATGATRYPDFYLAADWSRIPRHCRKGLAAFIEQGRPTGHFLYAVLSNDLELSVKHADDVSRYRLHDYVNFLLLRAPANCWGSREKVDAWQKAGGLQGGAPVSTPPPVDSGCKNKGGTCACIKYCADADAVPGTRVKEPPALPAPPPQAGEVGVSASCHIWIDPERCGGAPTLAHSRVTIAQVLAELAEGPGPKELAERFDWDVYAVIGALNELSIRLHASPPPPDVGVTEIIIKALEHEVAIVSITVVGEPHP